MMLGSSSMWPAKVVLGGMNNSSFKLQSSKTRLLTLGAHAPEGYGSCPVCVSVCLSVCVSVRILNLGTGASRGLNEGTSE